MKQRKMSPKQQKRYAELQQEIHTCMQLANLDGSITYEQVVDAAIAAVNHYANRYCTYPAIKIITAEDESE